MEVKKKEEGVKTKKRQRRGRQIILKKDPQSNKKKLLPIQADPAKCVCRDRGSSGTSSDVYVRTILQFHLDVIKQVSFSVLTQIVSVGVPSTLSL